jgi:hypothetical protein
MSVRKLFMAHKRKGSLSKMTVKILVSTSSYSHRGAKSFPYCAQTASPPLLAAATAEGL